MSRDAGPETRLHQLRRVAAAFVMATGLQLMPFDVRERITIRKTPPPQTFGPPIRVLTPEESARRRAEKRQAEWDRPAPQ